MNYKLNPNTNFSNKTFLYFLIRQGISLIGILSLLSSSIVVAQTENATPESTQQRTQTQVSTPRKTLKARKVNLKASQFGFNDKKPKKEIKLVEKSNSYNNRTNFYLADSGKNSYIDTTDYNTNPPAVKNPPPVPNTAVQPKTPSKVVITERSSGCSIVANGSQIQSNGCGGGGTRRQTTRVRTRTTTVKQPTQNVPQNRIRRTPTTSGDRVATRNQPVYRRSQLVVRKRLLDNVNQNEVVVSSTNTKSYGKSLNTTKYSTQQLTNPNKNIRPLTVVTLPDEIQAVPLSEFANYVAARNSNDNAQKQSNTVRETGDRVTAVNTNPARKTALLYPLSIPARFSSPFGWRIHPITGAARMHSGTDIAAPLGTPVLATYSGRVEVANSMGGYGLAITLRHANDTQESLYGHLSQILVQPGDFVEQGTVIGLVGSTGNSTGPHLHFEWRYLTTDGWVAVDSGQHLEYALDNLIQAMQMAKIAGDVDENKTTDENQKAEVKKLEVKK